MGYFCNMTPAFQHPHKTILKHLSVEIIPMEAQDPDQRLMEFLKSKGIALVYEDEDAFNNAEEFVKATKFTGGSYYRPHPAIINHDLLRLIEDEPIKLKIKRRESLMPPNAEQRRRHRETYKNNLAKRFPK